MPPTDLSDPLILGSARLVAAVQAPKILLPPVTHPKAEALRRYVREHPVTAIIVTPGRSAGLADELQAALGGTVAEVGGVELLSLPPLPRAGTA